MEGVQAPVAQWPRPSEGLRVFYVLGACSEPTHGHRQPRAAAAGCCLLPGGAAEKWLLVDV